MNRHYREKEKIRKRMQRALQQVSPCSMEDISKSPPRKRKLTQAKQTHLSTEKKPESHPDKVDIYLQTQDFQQKDQTNSTVSRVLIDPYNISDLIGDDDTSLPDDIIQMAVNLLKAFCTSDDQEFIGYYTVAELVLHTSLPDQVVAKPVIPIDQFSINIHPLNNHWVTSCQHPDLNEIHIYDSLMSQDHLQQVIPQIQLLFGKSGVQRMKYIPVTQQSTSPICGVMAIAFAFSCFLRVSCESHFDINRARQHLKQCMLSQTIQKFPLMCGMDTLTTECRINNYLKYQNNKDRYHVTHNDRPLNHSFNHNNKGAQWNERERKRKLRLNPDYREHEQQLRRLARQTPEKNQHENELKRKSRSNQDIRKKEEDLRRKARSSPAKKLYENELKKAARSDPEKKKREDELRRKARSTSDRKLHENELKKAARSDPEKKKHENELRRKARSTSDRKLHENELKKAARSDPEKKKHENEKRRKARLEPEKKIYDRGLKIKARFNPVYKKHENDLRRNNRLNPDKRKHEKERRRNTRLNPDSDNHEQQLDNVSKVDENIITNFKLSVSSSCDYECTCCAQLFFKQSVVKYPNKLLLTANLQKCKTGTCSVDNVEWICHTCLNYLKKNKIPPLSKENGMLFPSRPELLELNKLEERLISPLNIFMQMRELPSGRQVSIRGNVVNVPADSISTVQSLPRRPGQSDTVPVKLKRRLRYKTHYMYENVRPQMCLSATKYLLNKPLFKKYVLEGLDTDWLQAWEESPLAEFINTEQTALETIVEDIENIAQCDDKPQNSPKDSCTVIMDTPQELKDGYDSDTWSEDGDENLPSGETDTMLFPTFTDEYDGQQIVAVAPSEGNVPMSIFSDHVEELAFPTIFCGERRPTNMERCVPVKYSEIVKSELRNSDRRCSINITNLFFKTRKIQLKQIQDKVLLSLRRKQLKGKTFTAKDMQDQQVVDSLVCLDEGFKILRTLRGSPPYWENAKKDIFAMLRQCGLPTWFISLSAAETHWKPLLKTLGKIIDHTDYTENQIKEFTWDTKSRLIKSDPVTVARYFDYRVQQFFHMYLLSSGNPLGKIVEFWYRVEFQQRGSPHIHGLLWVQDAPKYQESDNKLIQDFVSEHVSTDSSFDTLVALQKHRHSHTCRKKNKKQCRFNFPLPPCSSTILLEPLMLSPGDNDDIFEKAAKDWAHIQTHMEEICSTPNITFPEFLDHLKMNEKDYITAIRSSMKDAKILLKREPCDTRINGYNKGILKAWEANHDIQFVTDAYACAMYIVSYISKGQRGMSELLRRACDDARKGGSDIRNQVREIGNKFTKHVEISAQEAAYITLQLPMRRSSRSFLFINTSPSEDRPFIVKDIEQIKRLPDDSEDIQCENVISRYTKRDSRSEMLCLADFAANYDVVFTKPRHKDKAQTELPESDIEQNLEDDPVQDQEEDGRFIKLQNGTKLRHRKKPKVIRYVNYSVKQDSENHYRERLMLFFPWRQENRIIGECQTYEEKYRLHIDALESKIQKYAPLSSTIDEIEEMLQQDSDISDQIISPITQHQEEIDRHNDKDEAEMENENLFTDYDIGNDIGITSSSTTEETIRARVTDVEYRQDVRSLNEKQYELFLHVLKTVKTEQPQFFLFITGGAGVGKSKLTKTLYQSLLRQFNTGIGSDPEGKTVILTAPTGKAAYLIGGATIHSTFCIPANQNLQHKPLNNSNLNTLRLKLNNLKVLFIDEVSMCGANMFNFINLRLQEVKRTTKAFGGVSVICIGDLFQLHPVMDKWIFHLSSTNYNVLAPNIWIDNMKIFELTEIMRQANDRPFAQTLNNIREGLHTQQDIELLSTRVISNTHTVDYPNNATHILYYNKSVQLHNSSLFDQADTEKVYNKALDIVIGEVGPDVKIRILEKAPILPGDSMGLPMVYRSAVGLRNELTLNIDVEDGLVNGAGGVCSHFTTTAGGKLKIVWIYFDDPGIGQQLRRHSGHLYKNEIQRGWTPITSVKRKFPVGKYKNAHIQRDQFPLNLTCAKTIHKCQGDTLHDVVVQLPVEKRPHVHYVALSRVTTLNRLHILQPFDPSKITVSKDVKLEMERLREHCQVQLCYTPLYSLPVDYFVICFQNSQSVKLHLEDIVSERNFSRTDVLILTESKLCEKDNIQIPGHIVHRNDFAIQRTPYGSIVITKPQHTVNVVGVNSAVVEMTLISVLQPQPINILGLYRPPNQRWKPFFHAMEEKLRSFCRSRKSIIIGDFNTGSTTYLQLCILMQKYQFRQIVRGVTTNNNTTIDLIFVNFDDYKSVGELESYYSHHKPVWVAV